MYLVPPLKPLMLQELVKEEVSALSQLNSILSRPPKLDEKDEDNSSNNDTKNIIAILEDLKERSGRALKECQLIESLDKQLRLLAETHEKLTSLAKINQLNSLILRPPDQLEELVPLVLEWRAQLANNSIDFSLAEKGEEVRLFVNEQLPELIDSQIEQVLNGWTDDSESRDPETMKLLSSHLRPDSANPLHGLFASFPLSKLKRLLNFHLQLQHSKRLERMYPERLLNRFYDILNGNQAGGAFSVGQIEELVPEKMKFATRISCILEATAHFSTLHPELEQILLEKCAQITRQIRKAAKEERAYNNNNTPAGLDAQLNEICLIIVTLTEFLNSRNSDSLQAEREKWRAIYQASEERYLMKGIQRAIEMDQIVSGDTCEYPVSSCVDDIFYVLQAARTRTGQILLGEDEGMMFIAKALREFFLSVLKRHLESAIETLKALNLAAITSPFRPTRELISTLVLLNNLISTRSNWRAFTHSNTSSIDSDLEELIKLAVKDGLYAKVLQGSVKRELLAVQGEDLFAKLHSNLSLIHSLFKVSEIFTRWQLIFLLL